MTPKYPFLIRLFLVASIMIFMGFAWAFIGIISVKSLGEVLKETGERLSKP